MVLKVRQVLRLPVFSALKQRVPILMTYDLFGIVLSLIFLAAIAMLVKYERRLKRWLLKHPKRRRKTVAAQMFRI